MNDYREWMKANRIDRMERNEDSVLGVRLALHRGEGATGIHALQFVPIVLLRSGRVEFEQAVLDYMVAKLNEAEASDRDIQCVVIDSAPVLAGGPLY